MSCRSTHAGTLATRLARTTSGLPDRVITSLFHALKREASGVGDPSPEAVEAWRAEIREILSSAGLNASAMSRSERDLLLARDEVLNGQTLHALRNIEARARQEAVLRHTKGMVVDLDEPGSQSDFYEYGPDGRPTHVWYASYGSNLSLNRFMTYVEGGSPEGTDTVHEGCRDKTPPSEDMPIRFAGRMHFAASSGRWDGGGVAFMDNDTAGHALGRAYLISMEQFDDIVAQENGKKVGSITVDTAKALAAGSEDVTYGLYGNMVHIGDYGCAPVFTFTGSFSANEALLSADEDPKRIKKYTPKTNVPSNNYMRMIGSGLSETFDMDVEQQADYIRGSLGVTHLPREQIVNVLSTPWEEPKPRPKPATTKSSKRGGLGRGFEEMDSDLWDMDGIARSARSRSWSYQDSTWPPKRDYTPWWEEEDPQPLEPGEHDYHDTLWDTPMALLDEADWKDLRNTADSGPDMRTYGRKNCVICGKRDHTMHDCPDLGY